MPKILVIDDHADLRTLVRTLAERAGHTVIEAADGQEGLRRLYAERPDLVLLDVRMPVLDGWATLARIRELSDVPVLMLSAGAVEEVRVHGLLAGADDVQPKPFSGPELLARMTALLRRTPTRQAPAPVFDDGWARLDPARHEAYAGGIALALTPLEFRLMAALLSRPGVAQTHDQLLEAAWQGIPGGRDQVKVAVLALRRRLDGATPGGGGAIATVRGVGYRWIGDGATRRFKRPAPSARTLAAV